MLILSVEFLGFILITLLIYFLLPGKIQNAFLLAVSWYFCFTWSPRFLLVLVFITAVNFALGFFLGRESKIKKLILWAGILTNAGLLSWFLIGAPWLESRISSIEELRRAFLYIVPPVGVSYFTLNGISYLIDISLRIAKPTTNIIDFSLYLAYFPKLVSGPLERARKFLPLLAEKRTVDNARIASSLTLILIGLTRAVIFGGVIALYNPILVLAEPVKHGAPALLWAMLLSMFMLYNQFAGYTDIARGVSGLYGIPLTRNFMAPFFFKDFSDFWQRWHISLSQWLRDYIYMPISRAFLRRNPSRTNIPNLIIPSLATMLVSGFWHGATPNFIVWGFIMGVLIVIENIRALYRPAVPQESRPTWQRFSGTVSLILIMMVAIAPFQMDLKNTIVYYRQLLLGWEWQPLHLVPGIIIPLSLTLDWLQSRSNDETIFQKWPVWAQVALAVSVTIGAMIVQQLQSAPPLFVYP